jgi:hypothetical protein
MSVVSMANAAAARRHDYWPPGRPPASVAELGAAAEQPTAIAPDRGTGRAAPGPDVTGLLKTATTYIPTEVVTMYLALTNALDPARPSLVLVAAFAAATPFLVLLVFAGRLRADGKPVPGPGGWPLWEMSAGCVAFLAWSIALPDRPVDWLTPSVAGVVLVIVTTLLGVAAPYFQRELPTK